MASTGTLPRMSSRKSRPSPKPGETPGSRTQAHPLARQLVATVAIPEAISIAEASELLELADAVSWTTFLTSMALTALLSTIYHWGIVQCSRKSIAFELAVTVVVPLLVRTGRWIPRPDHRLDQLVAFESIFNVISLAAKMTIFLELRNVSSLVTHLYSVFFTLQVSPS